jgi:hypothetical protein
VQYLNSPVGDAGGGHRNGSFYDVQIVNSASTVFAIATTFSCVI